MSLWHNITAISFLSLLLIPLPCQPARAEKVIFAYKLSDKLRGMWLGQLIGNYAGRETEGKYSGSIPNPAPSVAWVIRQEWDADDDTDIEYVALHILQTHGLDCNYPEIAQQWRTHIGACGLYLANKQAWYLMADAYSPPDTGSRTYNEHWYSIDSQITTEVLGGISPGLVQSAIDLASKFARVTNTGFAVHAAQFYSATYATAFFEPNVTSLVTEALKSVPTTSRTYQVVTDVLRWYMEDANDGSLDWRTTRSRLYDKYQGSDSYGRYYNWAESTINAGATVLAVLYGQGDFKNTVQIAVLAGWDCDCNAATAGGLIGIIKGFRNLPSDLTDPNICGDVYRNVCRPYLPDPNKYYPQYDTITSITACMADLAGQNILRNGGHTFGSGPLKAYHIPDVGSIRPEPEKPDPNGPGGLVAEAIAAGITVTPSAATQRFDTYNDRANLDSIIDGITDNSYNGHKAYYSRTSQPGEEDWYQLNFSRPVTFETLTFWEGDLIWQGINTYYKDDAPEGGFFGDLRVEVRRGDRFIAPVNLLMSPALDRHKMYQKITFTFLPAVGDAIRIIGAAGGTQRYTTIMELEAGGGLDAGLYVAGVEIAGGQTQRSNVSQIKLTFTDDVVITPDDIQIVAVAAGTVFTGRQISLEYGRLWDCVTLGFDLDSDGCFGDSLPDGIYLLCLDCSSTASFTGQELRDSDGHPEDGFYTLKFHKLFGDVDGSATVDLIDFSLLASNWLGDPADTGLDSNQDGILDFEDLAAFAANWLASPAIKLRGTPRRGRGVNPAITMAGYPAITMAGFVMPTHSVIPAPAFAGVNLSPRKRGAGIQSSFSVHCPQTIWVFVHIITNESIQ